MASSVFRASTSATGRRTKREESQSHAMISGYLANAILDYRYLLELKKEAWITPEAHAYFEYERKCADEASHHERRQFMIMMQEIAEELIDCTGCMMEHIITDLLDSRKPSLKLLDLGVAPGGFVKTLSKRLYPLAEICGITLPVSQGGHELLVKTNPRLRMEYADITMLAAEMGVRKDEVPLNYPDRKLLNFNRLFVKKFQIIVIDGQVLRTHIRGSYREKFEPLRLYVSQLTLAMQRIAPGGTIIMHLHKLDSWRILKLIYAFYDFSDVQLFKPVEKHSLRSSFYMVATNINPYSVSAVLAIKEWKYFWTKATFEFYKWNEPEPTPRHIEAVLNELGENYIAQSKPIWEIQRVALENALSTKFRWTY